MTVRILCIAGTRPEAIKIAPLLLAARYRADLDLRILTTGQQAALTEEALAGFGLVADAILARMPPAPDPDVLLVRLRDALLPTIAAERPDMVLVQGDTTSAYAGALAAARLGLPLAHLEAGLRSGDLASPWPEERNRIAIDRLADLLFAPTRHALGALDADPAVTGDAVVTGNTGIDALLWTRARLPAALHEDGHHRILLTCHRRESIGAGIAAICTAARRLAARGDVAILCPVHSNPAVAATVQAMLGGVAGIDLVAPLSYRRTVAAMTGARLILTDSGGIQEEAPAIGVPTLVLRDVTERAEGVASGNLRLVGTDPDRIVAVATELLDDDAAHAAMTRPALPFGDGRAAPRVLDRIAQYFLKRGEHDMALPKPPLWRRDAAPEGA